MTPSKFTNLERANILTKLEDTPLDVLVIGGGITGAGILLDAASRGLKVALIEKGDFASGTSSKSTKLIHGGLRYLKQLDFWLVKEVGSERAIVHKLAPHLVIPEKMLLPLIEDGQYGKILTSIGLKVYDILADVNEDDQRKMLNKRETLEKEPLLSEDILLGSGFYAEYRTDDARLTVEIIKTSINYGATAINYIKAVSFLYEKNQVCGITATDETTGNTFNIHAKCVVNAAGPWVDELRELNNSKTGKRLHLTKGVHLVFKKEKLPVKHSVYFDVPDGRMIFAIPRGKVTYVGTTDTDYTADKDHIDVLPDDANYLINAVNAMFPTITLSVNDVISSWAGLRPLIHEEGKSASELSRKDEIFTSETGLISIAGGKLTGYRKMAERIVNRVAKKLEESYNISAKKCITDSIALCGGPWENYKEVKKYIKELADILEKKGLSPYEAWYLTTTYGKQSEMIIKYFDESNGNSPLEKLILAEFRFCSEYELIQNPMDFFIRRTGRLYFDPESILALMQPILKNYAEVFSINKKERLAFENRLKNEVSKHQLLK